MKKIGDESTPGTAPTRPAHAASGGSISDGAWALIEPSISPPKCGGQPRDMILLMPKSGAFHMLETGWQRRELYKELRPRVRPKAGSADSRSRPIWMSPATVSRDRYAMSYSLNSLAA